MQFLRINYILAIVCPDFTTLSVIKYLCIKIDGVDYKSFWKSGAVQGDTICNVICVGRTNGDKLCIVASLRMSCHIQIAFRMPFILRGCKVVKPLQYLVLHTWWRPAIGNRIIIPVSVADCVEMDINVPCSVLTAMAFGYCAPGKVSFSLRLYVKTLSTSNPSTVILWFYI